MTERYKSTPEHDRLVADRDADPIERARAMTLLRFDRIEHVVPEIVVCLDDPDGVVRGEAIITLLGSYKLEEHLERGVAMLQADPDPSVRRDAAQALGGFVFRSPHRNPAKQEHVDFVVRALVRQLRRDDDWVVQSSCYRELLEILRHDEPDATASIGIFDRDKHVDWELLAPWLEEEAFVPPPPRPPARPGDEDLLADEAAPATERVGALERLEAAGRFEVADTVLSLLDHPEPALRSAAVVALVRGWQRLELHPQVVGMLIADPAPEARAAAAEAFAVGWEGDHVVVQLAEVLTVDPDPLMQAAARRELMRLLGVSEESLEAALAPWRAWRDEPAGRPTPDPRPPLPLSTRHSRPGDEGLLAHIHADPDQRAEAVWRVGADRRVDVEPAVAALLQDPAARVRGAAARVLVGNWHRRPYLGRVVEMAEADPDPSARKTAIVALAEWAQPRPVGPDPAWEAERDRVATTLVTRLLVERDDSVRWSAYSQLLSVVDPRNPARFHLPDPLRLETDVDWGRLAPWVAPGAVPDEWLSRERRSEPGDAEVLFDPTAPAEARAAALDRLLADRHFELHRRLRRLFEDPAGLMRGQALLALVRTFREGLWVPRAADMLARDPDWQARVAATAALGLLGRELGVDPDDVVGPLLSAVARDPDPRVSRAAYQELLRLLVPGPAWQDVPADFEPARDVDWALLEEFLPE